MFGFHGPDASKPGTPFRVFVNDDKITPFGSACPGSDNLEPIIGIATNVAINKTTKVEVHNIPSGKLVLAILGVSNKMWGPFQLPIARVSRSAQVLAARLGRHLPAMGH